MTEAPALRLDGVGKTARHGRAILRGVSFQVEAGSAVALMGANGAGKTTLLDLVCGLTRPTEGSVQVFGASPRAAVRSGLLGGMLQSGGLLAELSVAETVSTFARLNRRPVPDLAELDPALPALAERRIGACSGGEQQRVKWALAALCRPRLLVLDEPTAGMDWRARHDFWAQVRRHLDRGVAVLYATHYADEVDQIADRIVLLDAGRLVAVTDPGHARSLAGQAGTGGDVGANGLFDGLQALVAAGPPATSRGGTR